jgi:hypothetical protein
MITGTSTGYKYRGKKIKIFMHIAIELNILWIKIDPLDQYTMGFMIPHYTGISLE